MPNQENLPESKPESKQFSQETKDLAASDKTLKEIFKERAEQEKLTGKAQQAIKEEMKNPEKIEKLKKDIEDGGKIEHGVELVEEDEEGISESQDKEKTLEEYHEELLGGKCIGPSKILFKLLD